MALNGLTKRKILSIFKYDKTSGKLFWIKPNSVNKYLFGREPGKDAYGYRVVTISYKRYKVHRIIFFLENGFVPKTIDHINGDKDDNRIENLRGVSHRQNSSNNRKHRHGKLVGCYFYKERKLWTSQIRINGKQTFIGRFKTELEAHKAYMKKLKEISCQK